MTTGPQQDQRRDGGPTDVYGAALTDVLHRAGREAKHRLNAVSAAVYLLDERRGELQLTLADGGAPSLLTLPWRIGVNSSAASARALRSGRTAVLIDPDPADPDQKNALPYPYIAFATPVVVGDQRFGALTVLHPETDGPPSAADHTELEKIGDALAKALAELVDAGTTVGPGPVPLLVPPECDAHGSVVTPGWGAPSVPGSAGTSMMYPLRSLAEVLNRATAMDDIVEAAQYCVMFPMRAEALVLASESEGRLWVLGHSGTSGDLVRSLHGIRLDDQVPAAAAFRGHPLFTEGSRPSTGDPFAADEPRTEIYLPLVSTGGIVGLPQVDNRRVVGVCCLAFAGSRGFPPEERALLGMMAGLLGAAVARVELSEQQRAVAACLQRILLPAQLPSLPRLATTARYRHGTTTSRVGGDWYDVIKLAEDRAVLVVGDVEGHAMESAAIMGQVRTAVASYATEGHCPAVVIDRTQGLLSELGTDLTVTCCVVALDTMDGSVEVALAGHPAPLVRRPDDSVDALRAPSNVPLGVSRAYAYQGREHTLEPGSVLMLYTDGLTNGGGADLEARARAVLGSGACASASDLEQLADLVVTDVPAPQQRRDDVVCLLALYEKAEGQEAEPRVGSLHIQRRDLRGVRTARAFVHDELDSWGLEGMSEAMELVVSEIVTNALIHAGSDVDVKLRAFADHIRLEVRDSDSNPPVPSPLAATEEGNAKAEHGRGLLIVESLAEMWNSSPNGQGKTVSLNMPIPPAEPG